MSVIYRPHRGTLADSMSEAKEFENFREMFVYIQDCYKKLYAGEYPFRINELVLTNVHNDNRIGWRDVMLVCTTRMLNKDYKIPQCIGMCATDYDKV